MRQKSLKESKQKGYRHFGGDLAARQLSVSLMASWSATGQRTGTGGAAESSAGASLTHVGQSSVEIGLMNRRERETAGLLVFQYSQVIISWTSTHLHTTGRGSDGEVSRWHI